MAFDHEQHNFLAVTEVRCIREKGFSTEGDDWTIVYYPAASSEDNSAKVKVKKV